MFSFIYSNFYHINEWFGMTPTVGTCTLIVQMCVKLREASTIGRKFSFKKTELILRPLFALIKQALLNTEYIAIVIYIALLVY